MGREIYGGFMDKRIRQYLGLFSAIAMYYIVHEGMHFIYALCTETFKQVNFMGLGMQIDIYADKMSDVQLGIFCILGSVATLIVAYLLVGIIDKITKVSSKIFKACMYYITVAMLLIDPLYLSILCGFFGGGDMNGISLLIPEMLARIIYGIILVVNILVVIKIVLPKYTLMFNEKKTA